MAITKKRKKKKIKQNMTSVTKDVEKLESLFMAARMKNGVAFMEISTEVPQKAKCRINILSSHFIYEYLSSGHLWM